MPVPQTTFRTLAASFATAVALSLAGCGGDGASPARNQLQSMTYLAENGDVLGTVKADYQGGQLVRLRKYTAPGEDNRWDTADDVLGGYISCDINTTGTPLFDAYFESGNDYDDIRNCGLPQFSGKASAIHSTPYTGAGPDSLWFTSDDTPDWKTSVTRNSLGSGLSFESVNVNASGVVKPADGLVIIIGLDPGIPSGSPSPGIPPLPRQNTYTNASGHVSSISRSSLSSGSSTEAVIRYDSTGRVGSLHLEHSITGNPPSTWNYTALENQLMSVAASGGTLINRQLLVPQSYFDNSSFWQGNYPGPMQTVGGISYAELTDHLRVTGQGRIDSITELDQPGADGAWGTADDVAGDRIVFTYLP